MGETDGETVCRESLNIKSYDMTLVSEKPKNAKNVSKERETEREEEGGRVKKRGAECAGEECHEILSSTQHLA